MMHELRPPHPKPPPHNRRQNSVQAPPLERRLADRCQLTDVRVALTATIPDAQFIGVR